MRSAIAAAVPGVVVGKVYTCEVCQTQLNSRGMHMRDCKGKLLEACTYRPVRLADVLAALREKAYRFSLGLGIDADGLFIIPAKVSDRFGWNPAYESENRTCAVWNIYKDDLSKQSDTCLEFLESVLCADDPADDLAKVIVEEAGKLIDKKG